MRRRASATAAEGAIAGRVVRTNRPGECDSAINRYQCLVISSASAISTPRTRTISGEHSCKQLRLLSGLGFCELRKQLFRPQCDRRQLKVAQSAASSPQPRRSGSNGGGNNIINCITPGSAAFYYRLSTWTAHGPPGRLRIKITVTSQPLAARRLSSANRERRPHHTS